MIKNGVKQLWLDGKTVLNGWLSVPNTFTAEIMAEQDYDSLTIDLQHGLVGLDTMLPMLQAIRASGVTPLVRVPWLEPIHIMKTLDAGAYGIICPMINNRTNAEDLVSWVRYPPLGVRSFGPTRAKFSAGPGYAQEANEEIICMAMIETEQALTNLEEIITTPGLDGIYIGPADLSFSLSRGRLPPGFDREEPEILEAIQLIVDTTRAKEKRIGLHNGTVDYALRALDWGLDLVTISSDASMLAEAASQTVARFRSGSV